MINETLKAVTSEIAELKQKVENIIRLHKESNRESNSENVFQLIIRTN